MYSYIHLEDKTLKKSKKVITIKVGIVVIGGKASW